MKKLVFAFLIGAVLAYAAVRYGPSWLGWESEITPDPSRSAKPIQLPGHQPMA